MCAIAVKRWCEATLTPAPSPAVFPCLNRAQMDMMLPDVDADISAYPVGNGVVIEVAERPTSPSSRLVDHVSVWGQTYATSCAWVPSLCASFLQAA